MNQVDLIRKFHSALPTISRWIEKTVEDSNEHAVPVIDLGFPRLSRVFPAELLARAKVVAVNGEVPYPPLSTMGLPEFKEMENKYLSGITYNDTFYIRDDLRYSEGLHFHELVHVVQWDRLGVDNFLLAYGVHLMQLGYENNPFEQMAYRLQKEFDSQNLAYDVVDFIQKETDAIWENLAPMIQIQQ